MTDLKTLTYQEYLPKLAAEHNLNLHQLPHLEKIVVNLSQRELNSNETIRNEMTDALSRITGQKPKITRAKQSISGFKVRQNDIVGLVVTLRGKRMYDFLSRIINIALPRTRDFRGIQANSFDASGNLTLAIRDHTIFPEIPLDKVNQPFSFEITFAFHSPNPKLIKQYLSLINFPISD